MDAATTVVSSGVITSDKVSGTKVYGADERHIGDIDYLVIEKVSGRVVYAVMTFGGFLGLGTSTYPIPWGMLTYDTSLNGYRTSLTKEQVEGAPEYADREDFDWSDKEWNARMYKYYDVPPYM